LDTSKIKFDLGGDFLLSIADLLIPVLKGLFRGPVEKLVNDKIKAFPNNFNAGVKADNGFYNFGKKMPESFPKGAPNASITFDYQLDDEIRVYKDRIVFGINGTFFNNDKGYRVPPIKQYVMPMYDPEVPAKFQIFISNYMIESFGYSFLEKQPFIFPMPAWKFNNRIAPFDTSTFEGVFPFMTSRFGKKIPTDLIMRVDRMWDVTC